MKTKLIVASLLLSVLPLSAQADPATDRALRLNQEALSHRNYQAEESHDRQAALQHFNTAGDSASMAESRLKLLTYQQSPAKIDVNENTFHLAYNATK